MHTMDDDTVFFVWLGLISLFISLSHSLKR